MYDWVRPASDKAACIWGHPHGIQVGIWPADLEGGSEGGPRGLFRIGSPVLDNASRRGLVNFVAVEPVVHGARCFSELEPSQVKQGQGKFFWTGSQNHTDARPDPGSIVLTDDGKERLSVKVCVEPFINGANVSIILTFRSDKPDEVQFTVHSAENSPVIERCVLTATMGNYMRLRQLHLKDHIVHPRDVWPKFEGSENGFTADGFFPVNLLPTSASGDLLICATTDEKDPHAAPADPRAPWWQYRGSSPLTQYWRKPKGSWNDRIRLRVNGRIVYWAGKIPIPNGMAFENFDLVEPFQQDQVFIFGLSRKGPAELLSS